MIASHAPAPSSLSRQLDRWLQLVGAVKAPKDGKALTAAEASERKRLRVLVATGQAPPLGRRRLEVLDRKAEASAASYLVSRTDVSWTLTVLYADGGRARRAGLDYETAQDLKTSSLNEEGVIKAILEPEVAHG